MAPIDSKYTKADQDSKLLEVFEGYIGNRKKDLETHIESLNNEGE